MAEQEPDAGGARGPSIVDDLATVVAGWIARFPRASWAFLAAVALAMLVSGSIAAPLVVAAAAAVAAPRLPDVSGPRWTRAMVPALVVAVFPFLAQGEAVSPSQELLAACLTLAGAAGAVVVVQSPRRLPPWAAVVATVLAAAGSAVLAGSTPGLVATAFVGPALVAAACAPGRAALVAASATALWLTWTLHASGSTFAEAYVYVTAAEMGVALSAGVVVAARAARPLALRTVDVAKGDSASARLVVRLQRNPWKALLVALSLGLAVDPLLAARQALLVQPLVPTAPLALPLVALLAVREAGIWAKARYLVATAVGAALWFGLIFFAGTAVPMSAAASAAAPWLGLLWAVLAVAWIAGRRDPVGDRGPGPGTVVAAVVALAVSTVVAANRSAWSGSPWRLPQIEPILWFVVFCRVVVRPRSGRVVPLAWCLTNVVVSVLGTDLGAARPPELPGAAAVAAAACASVLLNTMNGAVAVVAARRIASLRVVPDTHPLIADWAVDRRGAAAP